MRLLDYLLVVRRNLPLVSAVAFVAVAAAVALTRLQSPVYTSTGRLQVHQATSIFTTTDTPPDADFVPTEIQFMESAGVRNLVRSQLGAPAPKVQAVQVGTTSVVEVSANGSTPQRARATTDAYMNAYLTFRRQAAIDALAATTGRLQATIDDLQRQIDGLSAELRAVNCPPNNASCPERTAIEQDRDARVQEQVPFRQKLSQLNIDAASPDVGAVVAPASLPSSPTSPKPVRNGVVALVLGGFLGIGLAVLFEARDDSVRDTEDLEHFVPDLGLLAVIPQSPDGEDSSVPEVVAITEPASPSAEAYRSLRTSLRFLAVDRDVRSIQVTSASESEGKTTTAANLGFVLARAGELVVMVDCDLRRPRLHEYFGRSNLVGLTSVLLGEATLADAMQHLTDDRRLWILPAGPRPPNPSDLLASARVTEVLATLQRQASMLVIDSPPLLAVSDAAVVSGKVDGTLLVVRAGLSSRKKVTRAVELLHQIGAPVLGSVLHTTAGDRAGDEGYWVSGSPGGVALRKPTVDRPESRLDGGGERGLGDGKAGAEVAVQSAPTWAQQAGTVSRAGPAAQPRASRRRKNRKR